MVHIARSNSTSPPKRGEVTAFMTIASRRCWRSTYSVEGASDAREYLPDILSHRIKLLEIFKNPGDSRIDLEFVVGERFDARAELFIALEFDLAEGFDQQIAIFIHVTDQGLDTEYRCLQGRKLGLRLGQRFLELIQRRR